MNVSPHWPDSGRTAARHWPEIGHTAKQAEMDNQPKQRKNACGWFLTIAPVEDCYAVTLSDTALRIGLRGSTNKVSHAEACGKLTFP